MARDKTIWGAYPEEWDLFLDEQLQEDLLPVVSNPGAEVSANSTMRGMGKTPSIYNKGGYVAGFPKWTSNHTTEVMIDTWREQPDYGICIQTRYVRAFDIDIEDEAQAIVDTIQEMLGFDLPLRYRSNSNKVLLAFRLPGEFGKQVIKTEHGMVEILANGQQFIAAGTHTSGVRYQWSLEIDDGIPEITQKQFDAIVFILESEFATEETTQRGLRKTSDDGEIVTDDKVQFLEEQGLVLEFGPEGQAHIECPFADQHTTEGAVSSTSYFPAGSRKYERGHFVCLHAHCEHRTDEEFEDAVGYRVAQFDEVVISAEEEEQSLPTFDIDKHGRPKATINNVILACRKEWMVGAEICYDQFRDEIIFYQPGDRKRGERENDNRFVIFRQRLEALHGFHPIGRELMRDAVRNVAESNKMDSAIEWVNSLEWDGVPRVTKFLHNYFGCEDNDYIDAVSEYVWTGLAGRVLKPGLKADMIPIMKGPQGYMKSTAIAAMAPSMDEFCEVDFDESDADLARKMRGVLVAEIPELRGLRTRAIEAIKAFTARTHEKWIPKYKEYSTTFPRRLIFIATTNDDQFLADATGNRRWLPAEVFRHTDIEGIKRDRDQLWAEATIMFKHFGLLFDRAEKLAEAQHERYMMRDAWYDVIGDWLQKPDEYDGDRRPLDREYVRVVDVAREALLMDPRNLKRPEEMRISDTLKAYGFEPGRRQVDGVKIRAWFPPQQEEEDFSDLA